MKKIILFAAIFSFTLSSSAQKKRVLIFEKYIPGTVKMLNRTKIDVPLNYDASNKAMMFMNDNSEMILTNNEQVDSVIIGTHKFIYIKGVYLECVSLKNGVVYIDWSLKNINVGYKGSYGQITQSKVQNINPAYWRNEKYSEHDSEVHTTLNENRYLFFINGEMVECKNKKNLLNIFKDKKSQINSYIKERGLNFKNVDDALELIDYCLGLK